MNNTAIFEIFMFLAGIVVVALCITALIQDYRIRGYRKNEANMNNDKFRSTDGE